MFDYSLVNVNFSFVLSSGILQKEYQGAERTDIHKGVCIALNRKGPEAWFTIINCIMGTPVKYDIKLYSPFLEKIEVLQKAFIHKGKKRVRRAKLYYLWEKRDPKEYTL